MAASGAWTNDEIQTLREGHAAGRTLTSIANELGRRPPRVSEKAKQLGLTWDTRQTESATRTRKAVCAELRARLEQKYLEEAERLLAELRKPVIVYNFGGRDNTYEEHQHPEPDAAAKLKLMQASGTAVDRALKLDEHQSAGTADGARSMLGRLGMALGITPAAPDDAP